MVRKTLTLIPNIPGPGHIFSLNAFRTTLLCMMRKGEEEGYPPRNSQENCHRLIGKKGLPETIGQIIGASFGSYIL